MKWRPRDCERQGHHPRRETRKVWLHPSEGYRGVVDDGMQTRKVCRGWFCDWSTEWKLVEDSRSTINSFSAPDYVWGTLKEKGVYVR